MAIVSRWWPFDKMVPDRTDQTTTFRHYNSQGPAVALCRAVAAKTAFPFLNLLRGAQPAARLLPQPSLPSRARSPVRLQYSTGAMITPTAPVDQLSRPPWGSDGVIRALKPGNPGGAKGPAFWCAFEEVSGWRLAMSLCAPSKPRDVAKQASAGFYAMTPVRCRLITRPPQHAASTEISATLPRCQNSTMMLASRK